MTFIIFLVWVGISVFIGAMFLNNLGTATITFDNEENGETYDSEEYFLTGKSIAQLIILIIWTAFAFWLIGKQMAQVAFMF